jgi:acyl-coenzyme A thioesterase PaaI-like protein
MLRPEPDRIARDSISAIRIKDGDGRVTLLDVARTEPGSILGVALLADSSPAATHEHGHGQRLVTATLSVQMAADLTTDPPAEAHIVQLLGDWPFVAGGGTITGGSGTVIASTHTTFVGFDRPFSGSALPADIPADGTSIPRLDDLAGSMVEALRSGRVISEVGALRSVIDVDPRLRNRFGAFHGASAYAALALQAREPTPPTAAFRILDSHVRFVRPITSERIVVEVTTVARSRRLTDLRAIIRTADDELLATGMFTVTER